MFLRRRPPARQRPLLEELEPRILYSADVAAGLLDAHHRDGEAEVRQLEASAVAAASGAIQADASALPRAPQAAGESELGAREITFVDMSVANAESLLAGLSAERDAGRVIEIVRIEAGADGIAVISDTLAQREAVTAVHLLSHGSDGQLRLGSTTLDAQTLLARADQVAGWGAALTADADLLLYGCDFAQSAVGQDLVQELAALTGADVAASTDLTGAAVLGGNWTLEYQTGSIEARVALPSWAQNHWAGLLATYNADPTKADGAVGSLRWAITQANANPGADTVQLLPGTYTLNLPGTGEDLNASGDLDLRGNVTITGAGSGSTVIDGNALDRVFDIQAGVTATLSDVTIRGGSLTSSVGAGVRVQAGATLNLFRVVVTENTTTKDAAGLYNSGTLNATDTTISNNAASLWGGGLYNDGGVVVLDRVTISSNSTSKDGGGIYNDGGSVSLTNVTVSGNAATLKGGGIYTNTVITVTNSTIANNSSAGGAGGIHKQGSGGATLKNSILANNVGGNSNGSLTSLGYNIDTANTAGLAGTGDKINTDPLLGPLQYNGGTVKTHALLTGSPAINAGNATAAPSTDPRGAVRLGQTDIGAYEYTLIAYEPFAYAPGSFNGANGGSGWAAGWSSVGSKTTIAATGLQDPVVAMPVSGGSAELSLSAFQFFVTQTRDLASNIASNGTTAWLSFLVRPGATNPTDYIGLEFGSGVGTPAFAGYKGSQFILEKAGGTGTVTVAGITPQAGQTYLLTVRIDFAAGADSMTLYVNPTPGSNAAASVYSVTKSDFDLGTFTRIGLAGGTILGGNNAALDEVRIAGSYLDVAPTSPSSVVNHAPAGTDRTVTTLEDTAYTFSAADFGFSDSNDSPAHNFTALRIGSLPVAGTLSNDVGAVGIGQSIAVADLIAGKLKFTPAADANGTGYASFTFQVQDDGGTANGGVDLDPTPNTLTVNVSAVNDAPVLTGSNDLNAIGEDPASNDGTLVSALIAGRVSDVDSGAFSGIAVIAVDDSHGRWQYTTNGGGSWNDFGTPSAPSVGAARLLAANASTSVRFVPDANWNGSVAGGLTFRAWDQSSGTAGATADTSSNGGSSAFSTTTASAGISVTSVNDAPAGTDRTVTTLEDTAYTFSVADFGFSDANDSPANVLAALRISSLPVAGTLSNDGVAVSSGQTIVVADISNGKLKFTPAANANGSGYASFGFQVRDSGGTDNGGVDLDPTPRTLTIDVTAVNDPPAGTDRTVTTLEDTAYTFSAADFGFSDSNDSPAHNFTALRIGSLPVAGTLSNDVGAVGIGQSIAVADLIAGKLKFTPAADANGTGYASFTFQVQDDGGTANGGVDLDPTPNTLTVNVSAVNDAPVLTGSNDLNAIGEDPASNDGTLVSALIAGRVSDVDSGAFSGIAVIAVDDSHGRWQYTTNGGGSWNDFGTPSAPSVGAARLLAANASTSVRFVPDANWNGSVAGGLTFRAWDQSSGTAGATADTSSNGGSSAFSTTTASAGISVTSVNDAPAGTDRTVTTLEDTAYTFSVADFGFSDANDSPANNFNAVRISSLPVAGTLTNNGAAVSSGQVIVVADISNGKLKFTPAADANGAGYASFTFRVRDDGGTANGGVRLDPTPRTMTIDVTATNDAPQNGMPLAQATAYNTPLVFSAANGNRISVADVDAGNADIEVTLSASDGTLALSGVDGLNFTGGGNGTASMSFTGTIGAINTALDGMTFTPTTNFAGAAGLTLQTSDQGNSGLPGALLDSDTLLVTVHGPVALSVDNDFYATGEEVTLNAASVLANGINPPSGTMWVVAVNGSPAAVGATIALPSGASLNMSADGTFVYDPNGAFNSLAQGSSAGDSFTYDVSRDLGGSGTGTVIITISGENDAPTLTFLTGSNDLNAIDEDPASNDGTLVSALIAGRVSDVDSGAFSGIAVIAVDDSHGRWQYTTNGGGSWIDFGTPSAPSVGAARLLAANASTSVRFVPDANWNGSVAGGLTFRAWDQSSGTAGATADTSSNGGSSAFSTTTASAGISVTSVNDAPAGTDRTVTTLEDTAYTFSVADFGFSDANDSPANVLAALRISSLPVAGTLSNDGVAVSSGQTIVVADISNGKLKFTPAANANGSGYASFGFQVRDSGGTDNGGVDLDPTPRTLTIDVTAVNDPPAGTDRTVTTLEDTAYTFSAADFGFSDSNDSPAHNFTALRIGSLPVAGTLSNDVGAVGIGQSIAVADLIAGKLKFTPAADANGTGYASFTFQVQDDGGTANGGVDLDPTPNTLTVNVSAVNDAPVLTGSNDLNAIGEDPASNDGTLVSALIAGRVSDVDSGAFSGIAVIAVDDSHGRWQYTTNGGGSWNDFGTPSAPSVGAARLLAANASTSVRFVPDANWNGSVAGGLTFRAWDQSSGTAGATADTSSNGGSSAFSTTTASAGISVTSVNDAPAGTDRTVTTLEDTAYTFSVADFGFSDANDSPANNFNAVRISSLPVAGTLTNNGAAVSSGQTSLSSPT
jgi:hypothetical protein